MRKKVLITGASRGIGEAIARKYAAEKYDLYLTCLRSGDKLLDFSDSLEQEYDINVNAFICDMSSYKEVEKLFAHIPDLDILVNNTGISHIGLLSEMDAAEWHRILDTNLSSIFYTSKFAIPLFLKKHEGKIINISSVWGAVGASMEVAYSASKGGMNSFTGQRTCSQQHPGQCPGLWCHRYPDEPMLFRRRKSGTDSGNPRRPDGASVGGSRNGICYFTYATLYNRADFYHRWWVAVKHIKYSWRFNT